MIADADENLDPVTYRIDRERGVVYFRLRGDVTFAALCCTVDAYLSDADYKPGMSLYADCRVLTAIPTRDEIRRLALDRLHRGRFQPTGRVAIVVMTRLGMDYAAAWELFSEGRDGNLEVFTSHEDAHEWLGVPVPQAID